MDESLYELFVEHLASECGIVAALLGIVVIFLASIWWLERKDRRAAWKARNEDMQEVIKVMSDQKTVMEVIKTLIQNAGH